MNHYKTKNNNNYNTLTTGLIGPMGIQGIQGKTGPTGPRGNTGDTGPAAVAIEGSKWGEYFFWNNKLDNPYWDIGSENITLGLYAGENNQGKNSVAIGTEAGRLNQHDNSIILNATGKELNSNYNDSFYVAPIRESTNDNYLLYNKETNEITYSNICPVKNTNQDLNPITILSRGLGSSKDTKLQYGNFISTSNQMLTANIASPIKYDIKQSYYSSSITLDTIDNTIINFKTNGIFKIGASLQINKVSKETGTIDLWFVCNGNPIDNSASRIYFQNNYDPKLSYFEIILHINSGDKIQIYAMTNLNNINIMYFSPVKTGLVARPAIPGIITTVIELK